MSCLHVVPCILRGNLCRVRNETLKFSRKIIFNFSTVVDISPTVVDISPIVADIPTVAHTFTSQSYHTQ